jgi:hypothetical protein
MMVGDDVGGGDDEETLEILLSPPVEVASSMQFRVG